MADLPASVDAGVLEELLQALLEVAARKDALRSWPRESPPDNHNQPPVQARRDEDGTLGVFRFFTIVDAAAPGEGPRPDPIRELTPDDARARIDGLDGASQLKAGDEVGVEMPLGRLAAIALADVEGTRDGRPHLLPPRIVEMLSDVELAAAVAARLSSLRGPPPHVPLRRLVTDHGDDVVEWTAVCGDVVDPSERVHAADEDGEPRGRGELIVLVSRAGDHRLVVVPTATSSAGHAALLRALAPPPGETSLWRFLEVEGPALLCGDSGALWSEETPADDNARRLSLEVKSIAISRDPTVYGVARARARLLTWSGNHIVDDAEAVIGLPVDLPRFVSERWPEGAALDRVIAAARKFREQLQRRLSALVDARQPTVADVLAGAAFLRILAREAAGAVIGVESAIDEETGEPSVAGPAEPTELRDVVDPPPSWPEDEIGLRLADVGVLVLSPAVDVVKLRPFTGTATTAPDEAIELFVDGALVDGDADGWRAFTDVFAQAIADAEVDVELAFPVDDASESEGARDEEVETLMLSEWLLSLGEPTATRPMRWPPSARAAESAAAFQMLMDRFVDAGPNPFVSSRAPRRENDTTPMRPADVSAASDGSDGSAGRAARDSREGRGRR